MCPAPCATWMSASEDGAVPSCAYKFRCLSMFVQWTDENPKCGCEMSPCNLSPSARRGEPALWE